MTGGVGNKTSGDHPTALLRSAKILRRVLEIWGVLMLLRLQGKPSAKGDGKNSQKENNDNDNNNSSLDYLIYVKLCDLVFL